MNPKCILRVLVALAATGCAARVQANQIVAGIRWHAEHESFVELPFASGDLSYVLGYEFHDAASALQLAVAYMPSPGGSAREPGEYEEAAPGLDYVLTPQANLIWKENQWRGGAGALRSMVVDEEDSDWTRFYWQIIVGLNIPFGRGEGLDLMAYYVFQRWRDVPDFRGSDIDFGATLGFRF